ncbi:AraC family transcriptional regulator [Desulfovibrio inopinatus]|uniref:AraC family transcriptional regulator n=1 Tax=Desulfovibrio inopinatus TaxID=102109 RepID=UPI00042972B7|nr:AraC family transcriptional regulator [Desulfovibrio inopinatus]
MKKTTEQNYQKRIRRVMNRIADNLDEDLSLASLAETAHLSPYHFHRVFRGMVGESVAAHIRRLRLERAAQQLMYTEKPVTEIAFCARYEAVESFSRAFSDVFGLSPKSYREAGRSEHGMPDTWNTARQTGPNGFVLNHLGESTMNVDIKTLEDRLVACVRHVGPYNECEHAWRTLCDWAGPKGLLNPTTQFIGVGYDDPEVTAPEKIRYDACITVPKGVEPEGKVGVMTLAGGEFAVTLHKGPYSKLAATYAELCGQWIPSSGREMASKPAYEVYLNTPDTTAPEELLTEIYLPLA